MTLQKIIENKYVVYLQQCDYCNIETKYGANKKSTYPKFNHVKLKSQHHYCSPKCVYAHRKQMNTNFRKITHLVEIKCDICQKTFKRTKKIIGTNNFCSKKCYGDAISKNICSMNISFDEKTRQKMGKSQKKRFSNKKNHPLFNTKHTKETKIKIGEKAKERLKDPTKNPMYGRTHTEKSRQQMSEKHSNLILNGKKVYGNNHVSGYYFSTKCKKNFFYRSSWELFCMKWLDKNLNICSYIYEPFKIEYVYFDKNREYKRYYVPDFLIEWKNGIKELWEIKPKQFIDNIKTQQKKKYAEQFCLKNNILCYKLLTKEDLTQIGVL